MAKKLTSLEKGLELLRIIASRPDGCQMIGLVAESGIPRTSALRLLTQLENAGLVDRSPDRRTLYLGPMLLRFGDLARQRHTLIDQAETVMAWLSDRTGQTGYLSARHGLDVTCLARSDSPSHVRAVMFEVGMRRPLGLGAGSIALLSGLDDEELGEVLELNAGRAGDLPYDVDAIRQAVRQFHDDGVAVHHGQLVAGVWGLGVPVRDLSGRPLAAISISFIASRASEEDQARYRQYLKEAAARLERRLHNNTTRIAGASRNDKPLEEES